MEGQARGTTDLAGLLIAAIEDQRERLNASIIADGGLSGVLELHVNPRIGRVRIKLKVEDQLPPYEDRRPDAA